MTNNTQKIINAMAITYTLNYRKAFNILAAALEKLLTNGAEKPKLHLALCGSFAWCGDYRFYGNSFIAPAGQWELEPDFQS